jgi:hypothetical protein
LDAATHRLDHAAVLAVPAQEQPGQAATQRPQELAY